MSNNTVRLMDQACKPLLSYRNIAVRPETHRRAKLLAVSKGMQLLDFIDKALDAYEVLEKTIEDSISGSDANSQGRPSNVVRYPSKSAAPRDPSSVQTLDGGKDGHSIIEHDSGGGRSEPDA